MYGVTLRECGCVWLCVPLGSLTEHTRVEEGALGVNPLIPVPEEHVRRRADRRGVPWVLGTRGGADTLQTMGSTHLSRCGSQGERLAGVELKGELPTPSSFLWSPRTYTPALNFAETLCPFQLTTFPLLEQEELFFSLLRSPLSGAMGLQI